MQAAKQRGCSGKPKILGTKQKAETLFALER
jgi:hypothetical protein